MKICFIGFGNMAKAIAYNLAKHKAEYRIIATSPSLKEGQTPEGIITHPDNAVGVTDADLVILAVKPAKVAEVLEAIKTKLPKHCLLISVVAGLSLSRLEQSCPAGLAIIRAMPNISIAVEKGATPLIANPNATESHKRCVETLFEYSGIITWVTEENKIDSYTALSGSGPAYVFLFLEAMIDAAVRLGINQEAATQFALQTVSGAAQLANNSALSIRELRKKVTSPAGTTAAAIAILEQRDFASLIYEAMHAAHERAKELGAV